MHGHVWSCSWSAFISACVLRNGMACADWYSNSRPTPLLVNVVVYCPYLLSLWYVMAACVFMSKCMDAVCCRGVCPVLGHAVVSSAPHLFLTSFPPSGARTTREERQCRQADRQAGRQTGRQTEKASSCPSEIDLISLLLPPVVFMRLLPSSASFVCSFSMGVVAANHERTLQGQPWFCFCFVPFSFLNGGVNLAQILCRVFRQ